VGCDTSCSLPPSTCEVDTLVYYSDGVCLQHQCHWQVHRMQCPGLNASCFSGGCSSTDTSGSFGGHGGQVTGIDVDVEAAQSPEPPSDAPIDHAVVAAPDAGSCTEGDDASTCVPQPSVCADERWLAYFTNGACHQNRCLWQVEYRDCGIASCRDGACLPNLTR
jgi:hypothetical protein